MTQQQRFFFQLSNTSLFRVVNLPPLTLNASADVRQSLLSQPEPEIYTLVNHHNIYWERKKRGKEPFTEKEEMGGRKGRARWNQHHGESSDEPQLMWSRISIYINTHFNAENLQILQPVLKVCLRGSFSLRRGLGVFGATPICPEMENKCKCVLQASYCCFFSHCICIHGTEKWENEN